MQDLLLQADETDLFYDLVINGTDFASVDGFESAIPVSLFTDSRAPAIHVPEPQNRRGWIGNLLTVGQERELGGLLWLLEQARINTDTLNLARAFAEGSMAWITDDNIANGVSIDIDDTMPREIKINVAITADDNSVLRFVTLWRNTDLSRIAS